LLTLSPILLLIAIGVKLDSPGPVLFIQPRRGLHQRTINVLKFRTMRHSDRDVDGVVQALPGDQRVTRLGRVLRRFSFDELPQMLNVLLGDMSMVGPRPHALQTRVQGCTFEDAVPGYMARYNVKPGITGLAQVHGFRGPTRTVIELENRVRDDLEYVERWSLRLDVMIIAKTLPALVRAKNAC
jgi:lipopolysaccharide/colanic/teichoic acid biosynthesis glycosyltransferase